MSRKKLCQPSNRQQPRAKYFREKMPSFKRRGYLNRPFGPLWRNQNREKNQNLIGQTKRNSKYCRRFFFISSNFRFGSFSEGVSLAAGVTAPNRRARAMATHRGPFRSRKLETERLASIGRIANDRGTRALRSCGSKNPPKKHGEGVSKLIFYRCGNAFEMKPIGEWRVRPRPLVRT